MKQVPTLYRVHWALAWNCRKKEWVTELETVCGTSGDKIWKTALFSRYREELESRNKVIKIQDILGEESLKQRLQGRGEAKEEAGNSDLDLDYQTTHSVLKYTNYSFQSTAIPHLLCAKYILLFLLSLRLQEITVLGKHTGTKRNISNCHYYSYVGV